MKLLIEANKSLAALDLRENVRKQRLEPANTTSEGFEQFIARQMSK